MITDTQSSQDYCERINDVKQYIREHIDEPLNREVLAAVAGFSVSHFHRIFSSVSVPVSFVNSIAGRPLKF